MKTLLFALCATVGIALVNVGAAQAAGGGCNSSCSVPVASAPAPTGTTAQVQPATSYRTYSYQPAPTYYQSYSSRPMNRVPTGFHDAGWKVRGN